MHDPHRTALVVFLLFFGLVTVAGFWAARWRRPDLGIRSLDEWGLAGRSFGTWITWFLIGGDLYTAYTVIAVPAALYGNGALGFFAVPYAVIAYPYMMLVLPRLWKICHRHGYVTFADFVGGRFGNRALVVAIAVTGILALLPYIALQLVGMRVVLASMGLRGEWPLAVAFIILAAYTYSSGLRAPAVIAIVKDLMLYIMVAAALILLPLKLGGYALIFERANNALQTHGATIYLREGQFLPYSTLALGSALALMLYPHTATAVLSARSANTVRRNAALLPAYSFLLGLIALLGYVALAAGVRTSDTSSVVPLLFLKMFPEWFAGFCLAAIAIGALVPAAIMSIAASNLFTRNLYGVFARQALSPVHSLAASLGALRRLGRGHGGRNRDGRIARAKEFHLSGPPAGQLRPWHARDVRGRSRAAPEPPRRRASDARVSPAQDRRWNRHNRPSRLHPLAPAGPAKRCEQPLCRESASYEKSGLQNGHSHTRRARKDPIRIEGV